MMQSVKDAERVDLQGTFVMEGKVKYRVVKSHDNKNMGINKKN